MTENRYRFVFAKEFSRFPGGRLRKHGPKSGEEFREEFLFPMLDKYDVIELELSNATTYGSSFLDESFGEAGKKYGEETLRRRLVLKCDDDPSLVPQIWEKIRKGAMDRKGK